MTSAYEQLIDNLETKDQTSNDFAILSITAQSKLWQLKNQGEVFKRGKRTQKVRDDISLVYDFVDLGTKINMDNCRSYAREGPQIISWRGTDQEKGAFSGGCGACILRHPTVRRALL